VATKAHKRLSGSDMSNLLAERGPIHVHVGATIIVEGAPPSYDQLVAHVEKRLVLVPRFRQRIMRIPFGIENPVWGDDPSFDVRRHVRHVSVPRPGRLDQLRDLVGRVMSEPLDMERPLWQLYLVEGLSGRHAYISKTHHALVDGVAAVDVGTILLDTSRRGTRVKAPEKPWDPDEPSPTMLVAQAASDRVQRPIRAAGRAARNAVRMPAQTTARVLRTAEAFTGLASGGPRVPRSSLNVRIGRDRVIAWARTDLDRMKRAREIAEGSTVNDVILSVAAGALRRYLEGRGDKVPDYLVALVPVSVRRPNEKGELGNRISTIMVRLPLHEPDPAKRLELLRVETKRLKESDNARAASLLIEATGWAPPTLNRLLSSAMARPLIFNLVVSNVPGPQQPLYLLGRQIREIYPFVPLSPQNHALSIGMISYDGRIYFGLAGDRDVLPDLDDLAGALAAALREQPVPRAKPKPRPKPKAKPAKRETAKPVRKKPTKRRRPSAPARLRARVSRRGGRTRRG
jgi:diacylglycerol O-acyltransferase / wax synthase